MKYPCHSIGISFRVLFLLCLISPLFALRTQVRVDSAETLVFLNKFGFLPSGTAHVAFSTISDSEPPAAWILGCSAAQLEILESSPNGIKSICTQPQTALCDVKVNVATAEPDTGSSPIPEGGTRFFYLINCGQGRLYGNVDAVYLNPDNQHLDSWSIPLLILHPVFLGLSGAAMLLLFVNAVTNERVSSHLYKLIWICFISDILFFAAGTLYWRQVSSSGEKDLALVILLHATHGLTQLSRFSLLLAIAFGYGLSRSRLAPWKYASIIISLGISATFSAGQLVDIYALFMSVPFLVAFLFVFARAINHSLRQLEIQAKESDSSERLDRLLAFLRKARIGIIVFMIMLIAIVIVSAAVLSETRWVWRLIYYLLSGSILWVVAFALRLRDPAQSLYLVPDLTSPPVRQANSLSALRQVAPTTTPDASSGPREVETSSSNIRSLGGTTTTVPEFLSDSDILEPSSSSDVASLNDSDTPSTGSGPSTSEDQHD